MTRPSTSHISMNFSREAMIFIVVLVVLGALTFLGSHDNNNRKTDTMNLPQTAELKVVSSNPVSSPVVSVVSTVVPVKGTKTPVATGVVAETGTKVEIGTPENNTGVERNTAQELGSQLKKAKTTVKEAAIGAALGVQLKNAKSTVKEALRGEYTEGETLAAIDKKGRGRLHTKVGGTDPRAMIMPITPRDSFVYEYSSDMPFNTIEADRRPATRPYPTEPTDMSLAQSTFGLRHNVYVPKHRTFSVDPGWNGFDQYEPPVDVIKEHEMADDSGSTSSSFEVGAGGPGGGELTNGIGKEDWNKKSANWASVKDKLLGNVKNITALFDRLFSEELFPDAVVDVQTNGQVYLRDGKEGKCIRIDRYYEYVQSSIIMQLSLGTVTPLPWAKSVELGFDAIEKAKAPLRSGILCDCGKGEGSYIISPSGEIKTSEGKEISVVIPWPKDNSVLLTHSMRFKKH